MISMMEMTTGQWESDYSALDARVSGDSTARLDAYEVPPMAHAGLCEHVVARSRYAGMPQRWQL